MQALIDPRDVVESDLATDIHQSHNRSSVLRRLFHLAACLGFRTQQNGLAKSKLTTSTELERQEARSMREAALAKRQARGSIMYERGEFGQYVRLDFVATV